MVSYQTTGGNFKLHLHPSILTIGNVTELPFSLGKLLHDRATMFLGTIDVEEFHWFRLLALLIGLENGSWSAYAEFKPFTTHLLCNYGHLELTSAFHRKGITNIFLNLDGNVA